MLAGRDEARLTRCSSEFSELAPGIEVELVVGDLGAPGVETLVAALDGRVIDVLVNNAGFGTYGRLEEVDRGPGPRADRGQRRRVGAPHPRRAARHAGPGRGGF